MNKKNSHQITPFLADLTFKLLKTRRLRHNGIWFGLYFAVSIFSIYFNLEEKNEVYLLGFLLSMLFASIFVVFFTKLRIFIFVKSTHDFDWSKQSVNTDGLAAYFILNLLSFYLVFWRKIKTTKQLLLLEKFVYCYLNTRKNLEFGIKSKVSLARVRSTLKFWHEKLIFVGIFSLISLVF